MSRVSKVLRIAWIQVLAVFLPLAGASANCYEIANKSLPGGDWGMISRDGVIRELMCKHAEIQSLEGQLASGRASHKAEIDASYAALQMTNRVSILLTSQAEALKKWQQLFGQCENDSQTLVQCIDNTPAARLFIRKMVGTTEGLLSEVNSTVRKGSKKRLSPLVEILSKHLSALKRLEQRSTGGGQ